MKFTTLLNYHLIDDAMLISISLLDDLILGFCYKSLTKETSGFEFGSTTNHITSEPTNQVRHSPQTFIHIS